MNNRGRIAVLTLLMLVFSTALCFAEDDAFALKSSYPEDGQENTSVENLGVKLYFNHSISSKAAKKNNEKCVKILDEDGDEVPIQVLTADDDSGLLLVLGDNTDEDFEVDNNANYELVISEDLMDDEGNTLGKETTVEFKTFNQRLNMTVNMVMMAVMFGGIMVLTVRQQRNQEADKSLAKEKTGEAAFNPYKEAKRTGKSVEEVMEEEKKRRAKAEKRAKRKGQADETDEKLDISALLPYVYKVHRPRPISSAGSHYKSGRGKQRTEDAPKRQQSKTRKRKSGK